MTSSSLAITVSKISGDSADLLERDPGLIVSGRASFELMQETLLAGIPLLAGVSAPSSLAGQLANEFNVSLLGFLRDDTFNIYSAGDRIT